MCKRIIFYVGQVPALDLFTIRLREGFEEAGAEVFIYDLEKNNTTELANFCNFRVDAIVTFNTMFYNMLLQDGGNAWEDMGIPFVTILVDHPSNFSNTIKKFGVKDMVLCIDRKHMDYVERYFSNVGRYGFLPHGGALAKGYLNSNYENRKLDIVYAGGIPVHSINQIIIPNEVTEKYNAIFDVAKFTLDIFHNLIYHPSETLESLVEKYVSTKYGIDDTAAVEMLIEDFYFLHNYIVAYYRIKVLEQASESCGQLYIYGSGYDNFGFVNRKNVHLMGSITPEEVLDVMNDAKIVLSTMAWFKDGSHERIYNGMLARAVVISENTPYLEEVFNTSGENQELIVFDLNNLSPIKDSINQILNDTAWASKIAANGYKKAIESQTWAHRGIELYDSI